MGYQMSQADPEGDKIRREEAKKLAEKNQKEKDEADAREPKTLGSTKLYKVYDYLFETEEEEAERARIKAEKDKVTKKWKDMSETKAKILPHLEAPGLLGLRNAASNQNMRIRGNVKGGLGNFGDKLKMANQGTNMNMGGMYNQFATVVAKHKVFEHQNQIAEDARAAQARLTGLKMLGQITEKEYQQTLADMKEETERQLAVVKFAADAGISAATGVPSTTASSALSTNQSAAVDDPNFVKLQPGLGDSSLNYTQSGLSQSPSVPSHTQEYQDWAASGIDTNNYQNQSHPYEGVQQPYYDSWDKDEDFRNLMELFKNANFDYPPIPKG